MFLEILISGLAVGSIYALVALGMSIFYASTDIINFSQGEFVMIGGFLAFTLMVTLNLPFIPAVIGVLILAVILSVVFDRLLIRPLNSREVNVSAAIIATVGVSIFLRGGVPVVWGTYPLGLPSPFGTESLTLFGRSILIHYLLILGVTAVCVVVLWYLFEKTMLGLTLRATAISRAATSLMGIDTTRTVLLSGLVSMVLAGIGGLIITPITVVDIHLGVLIMFKAFTGAILGGFGNHIAVFLGALLVGLLEAFVAGYVFPGYRDVVIYVLLLAVLLLKPAGLFARHMVERQGGH